MTQDKTYMEFPCDFPIKIIGANHGLFIEEIMAIARKHYPALSDEAIRHQPSQQGNYLAISMIVRAEDQATLDAFYKELSQQPDVKMVL